MNKLRIIRKISAGILTAVIVLLIFLIVWFTYNGASVNGLPLYISEQYSWTAPDGTLIITYGKPSGCILSLQSSGASAETEAYAFAGKYDYAGNASALEEAGLYRYYNTRKGCIYVKPETLKEDTQFPWQKVMTDGEEKYHRADLDLSRMKPEGVFDREYGIDWHMDNTGSIRVYLDPEKSGKVSALRILMIHRKDNATLIGEPLLFDYPDWDPQSNTSGYTVRKGSEQVLVHCQLNFHEDTFNPEEYRELLEALHLWEPLQKGYLNAREDIAENPDFLYAEFIREADLQTNLSFWGLPAYDVQDYH